MISRRAAACGLYGGVGNEHKIFMVLLSAREMGVKPMEALNGGLWNIQGKIEVSARLMSSMIRKQGHSIRTIEHDSKICILEGKRKDNGDTMRAQFSWDDAIKAGLAGRETWKKFAEDMLYNRALSRLARRLFADVVGVSSVEGEIKGECEIIPQEPVNSQPLEIEHVSEDEIRDKLNEFLSMHDVEDHELVKEFLQKYANHFSKTFYQSMLDYEKSGTFIEKFEAWKLKQLAQ
ncbi:MAG: hypothetical protein Q8876_05695 [Bacillota bacterium]|nr:hypothetical protein [Bacillota bacterium]